jgi:hypothetical protein
MWRVELGNGRFRLIDAGFPPFIDAYATAWRCLASDGPPSRPGGTEFGANALPDYEALIQVSAQCLADLRPRRGMGVSHAANSGTMRAWGDPADKTPKQHIPITQSYVARLFPIALERARRLRYETGGIPALPRRRHLGVGTMVAVDFYRVPTNAHLMLSGEAFYPWPRISNMIVTAGGLGEEFRRGLWVLNDEGHERPGAKARWRVNGPARPICCWAAVSRKLRQTARVKAMFTAA